MSVAVRVKGLRKSFRDATRTVEVLRGADLELEPGEVVAVVGPSGSGKSTLLHLLGGLERADEGEIEIGGRRIDRLPQRELAPSAIARSATSFSSTNCWPTSRPSRTSSCRDVSPAGRRRSSIGGRANCSAKWAWRIFWIVFPANSRAASSSGWRSAGRFSWSRRWCSPTSRRGVSTRRPATPCSSLLLDLQRRHRTTALVVTHNRDLARRCARILLLEGGILRSGNA